nr:hypothetical protein [uncultured Pseudomonas sp.]
MSYLDNINLEYGKALGKSDAYKAYKYEHVKIRRSRKAHISKLGKYWLRARGIWL